MSEVFGADWCTRNGPNATSEPAFISRGTSSASAYDVEVDLVLPEHVGVGALVPLARLVAAGDDMEAPVCERRVVEHQHDRHHTVGVVGGADPVRMVLVHRVHAAVVRTLQVQLLGEEHRIGAEDVACQVEEARIVGPLVERGTEMGERLDAVDDVAVALPLDHRLTRHVGIEHVAAGVDASALTVAHEVGDELLARVDHLGDLGGGEHALAHDEAVVLVLLAFSIVHRSPREGLENDFLQRVTLPRTFEAMAQPDEVRAEVRDWLASHWDPDLALVEWRTLLADSGWACPSWPQEWFGKGLPAWSDSIVHDEIADAGAVGPPVGGGMGLAAPTILAHGPDSLRAKLLHPILTGEHMWCQLFSEPGSGSDLAGLTTRAERDGDEWVINGQKVWNTSAHHAEYGMLLARTDWDVPKHKGISYFALPMHQPGVEVRPLRQMNRHASFNEVFLTDARVPVDMMVGEPGEGWRAALDHARS